MNRTFKRKVAIITGGGTGIGEAICRKFAREGARIVVNGLPGDPIEDVVDDIIADGGVAEAFAGDVSREDTARKCISAAIRNFGQLDILINNAGVLVANAETGDMPVDKFDEQIRCNIRSAFLMTKFALPHLQKTRGKHRQRRFGRRDQWTTEEHRLWRNEGFLHSFMQGVAVEQAQYGVRANCVCPGPIDTAWTPMSTRSWPPTMRPSLQEHCGWLMGALPPPKGPSA